MPAPCRRRIQEAASAHALAMPTMAALLCAPSVPDARLSLRPCIGTLELT